MNYQTVATISPAVGATGTWGVNLQLLPHPVGFAGYIRTDSLGTFVGEVMNSQLTPPTHGTKYMEWQEQFTRWRLAYASVTIYQDGPDLANQGTVVAAQKPVSPLRMTVGGTSDSNFPSILPRYNLTHPALFVTANDLPDYAASQGMPNAYFSRSKEGVYMPLKLTRAHQRWLSAADSVYHVNDGVLSNNSTLHAQQIVPRVTRAAADLGITGTYPFPSLESGHFFEDTTASACYWHGLPTSDFASDVWGDISFANLATTTSLSLFFRYGWECQVQPQSPLAPHMKLSPMEDSLAIQTYYAVSRELKDAYPADYNDLGKIWDVISKAAKTIAPIIGTAFPGVGTLIAGGIHGAAALGDTIRATVARRAEKRKQAPKPRKGARAEQLSAADKERAHEAQVAADVNAANKLKIVRRPRK